MVSWIVADLGFARVFLYLFQDAVNLIDENWQKQKADCPIKREYEYNNANYSGNGYARYLKHLKAELEQWA